MTFEVGLYVGVVAFYVYDATTLLYVNEVIFTLTRRGWAFTCPTSSYTLNRRVPFVAGVFTPFTPRFHVYRTQPGGGSVDPPFNEPRYLAALLPVRLLAACLTVMLFVLLPVILFIANATWLLYLFAATYLSCLSLAILIFTKRTSFGLSNRECVSLCSEILLCPPFAVSVIPKMSRGRFDGVGRLAFAREKLTDADYQQFVSVISDRSESATYRLEGGRP